MVTTINNQLLMYWEDEQVRSNSIDTAIDNNDAVNFPVEFLNSLILPGLPSPKLELKFGSPIMLLWNLDASRLYTSTVGSKLSMAACHRSRNSDWMCRRSILVIFGIHREDSNDTIGLRHRI